MFWRFNSEKQSEIRDVVDRLVHELSFISGNPQIDQFFPFVGRKDRRKAESTISILSNNNEVVVDPFVGSGTFAYACQNVSRNIIANEWEVYTHRMASSAWNVPTIEDIESALEALKLNIEEYQNYLYQIVCDCGELHVLDSQFFDRNPLTYINVANHERLGPNGETIAYRGKYKCPHCNRINKFFKDSDLNHLKELDNIVLDEKYANLFNSSLIENSRINITGDFTVYGNLFPKRSKLSLISIWEGINSLDIGDKVKIFFQDTFFSILPQAKYKDYRSKSQDLHCPNIQLREVNIWFRFNDQLMKRHKGFSELNFRGGNPISCLDYRTFFQTIGTSHADLIFTDPPWTDGNAYFEKAQLYHPWLNYNLIDDSERLNKEFVVTDAPSRKRTHDIARWWEDLNDFFREAYRILKDEKYLALFFRPIPASKWLQNLNRIKLYARKNGFEPILSIDVGSSDPSMRIQQSASFVFSTDIIFLFIKLPSPLKRVFRGDNDIDYLVYRYSEELQEELRRPFSYREWKTFFTSKTIEIGLHELSNPREENLIFQLFQTYCDEVSPGLFLTKPITPYSGQVFDIPAIERLFTYIPHVVNDITRDVDRFSYDSFLLKLSEYLENGTRMLIDQVNQLDLNALITPYAEPLENGRYFHKRALPNLPIGLKNVYELEPYDFEAFIARLLESQGYTNVVLAGRSGDRGVDVIANDPSGNFTVVQCKRWIGNVSATPIQRIHSFAITRGANRKIVVTTSDFTPHAVQEAENTGTELINGKNLEYLIAQYLPNYFNE